MQNSLLAPSSSVGECPRRPQQFCGCCLMATANRLRRRRQTQPPRSNGHGSAVAVSLPCRCTEFSFARHIQFLVVARGRQNSQTQKSLRKATQTIRLALVTQCVKAQPAGTPHPPPPIFHPRNAITRRTRSACAKKIYTYLTK